MSMPTWLIVTLGIAALVACWLVLWTLQSMHRERRRAREATQKLVDLDGRLGTFSSALMPTRSADDVRELLGEEAQFAHRCMHTPEGDQFLVRVPVSPKFPRRSKRDLARALDLDVPARWDESDEEFGPYDIPAFLRNPEYWREGPAPEPTKAPPEPERVKPPASPVRSAVPPPEALSEQEKLETPCASSPVSASPPISDFNDLDKPAIWRTRDSVQARQDPEPWTAVFTSEFKKAVKRIDRTLQGRVLAAVIEVAEEPTRPHGDTVKRLTGDLDGYWRYRLGDYRLIYLPEPQVHRILFIDIESRGSVYQ